MEWFEKEYKDRFKNESTSEGVDQNLLWETISTSIPQDKPKHRLSFLKVSVLVGILLLLIGSFFVFDFLPSGQTKEAQTSSSNSSPNKNQSKNIFTQSKEEKSESSEKGNLAKAIVLNDYGDDSKKSDSINASIGNSNISRLVNTKNAIPKGNSKESKVTECTSHDKVLEYTSNSGTHRSSKEVELETNNSSDSDKTGKSSINRMTESDQIDGSPEILVQKEVDISTNTQKAEDDAENELTIEAITLYRNENTSALTRKTIGEIPRLPEISPSTLNYDADALTVPQPKQILIRKHERSPWAVSIYGDANFMDLNYRNNEDSEGFVLHANEAIGTMQAGIGVALELEYEFNDNWAISSGLRYNQYETKLDVVLTSEIMEQDTLGAMRNVQKVRTVKNHNKLSTLSIPLQLSYQRQLSSRLSLGAAFDVSYALVTSQKGRVLGPENTIIDYTGDTNAQFGNFVSYGIQPFLRYSLNEKVDVDLTAGISFQNHMDSKVLELGQRSKIYNLGFGIRYRL